MAEEYRSVLIQENGTIKIRPEQYNKLTEVDVTTAVQPIQSRTLTIKKLNGAYLPQGYYYSRVMMEVPVEEREEVITENGEYEYEPSEDAEAISKVKITVDVPSGDLEEKEITVTENGETEILPSEDKDGFSKVTLTVDVQPDLEEKTLDILENGTYTIESDKDGISKATINVDVLDPSGGIFVQSNETTISANGDTILIPTVPEGYEKAYYDKVKIHTDVTPLLEDRLIQANGVYTPSAGKDGFSQITVDVNGALTLQEGNITLTENGRFTLNPEEGYDGLSKADIVVNIKPQLENVNITSNGVYTSVKDGYNVVSVNVPPSVEAIQEAREYGAAMQKAKLTGLVATTNGVYSREDGYDNVVVNVQGGGGTVNNQNKTIISNGIYTADAGYTGLGIVTVDVPSTINNQNKTITSNGVFTYDYGYSGLGQVTVNVLPTEGQIQMYKAQGAAEQKAKLTTLNITANGNYTREDGYNAINVNVPQTSKLQSKSVDITNNGTVTLYPDDNYDGLSFAQVKVNVPTTGQSVMAIRSVYGSEYVGQNIFLGLDQYDEQETLDLTNTLVHSQTDWDQAFYRVKHKTIKLPQSRYEVTSTREMFAECSNLTTIEGFDTFDSYSLSKVKDASGMFRGSSITSAPSLTMGNCTDFTRMFEGTKITNPPNIVYDPHITPSGGHSFPTTVADYMYRNCPNLINVNMKLLAGRGDSVFANCNNLRTLEIDEVNGSFDNITGDCPSLQTLIVYDATNLYGYVLLINDHPNLSRLVLSGYGGYGWAGYDTQNRELILYNTPKLSNWKELAGSLSGNGTYSGKIIINSTQDSSMPSDARSLFIEKNWIIEVR